MNTITDTSLHYKQSVFHCPSQSCTPLCQHSICLHDTGRMQCPFCRTLVIKTIIINANGNNNSNRGSIIRSCCKVSICQCMPGLGACHQLRDRFRNDSLTNHQWSRDIFSELFFFLIVFYVTSMRHGMIQFTFCCLFPFFQGCSW